MNDRDEVKFLKWFTRGYNVVEKNIYGGEDYNEQFAVDTVAYKYDTYITGYNYHNANEIHKLVDFIEWFVNSYEVLNRQIYNVDNGNIVDMDIIVNTYTREKYNETHG